MAKPVDRPIQTNYAYLPRSSELASQLAQDVVRLAPRQESPGEGKGELSGIYFLPSGRVDFALKAFIIDEQDRPFPETGGRPRFILGFTAALLDELRNEEDVYTHESPRREIETITVEGGSLDAWTARMVDPNSRPPKGDYPLRLADTVGERDVVRTNDPIFPDIVTAKGMILSFYMRYDVASLSADKQWSSLGHRPGGDVDLPDLVKELPDEQTGISDEELASLDNATDLDEATWRIATLHSSPDEEEWRGEES